MNLNEITNGINNFENDKTSFNTRVQQHFTTLHH